MSRTCRHSAGRERGAALIVAIGVLTLLLVIALTFFRASLGDMRTAQNTVDGVRAELLADGATAVAIGFLNHDRLVHPTASSLDHAWRTYFNGSWAVGKPWLWAPMQDPDNLANGIHRLSPLRGGVPEVETMNLVAFSGLGAAGAPSDSIYIPRADFAQNILFGLQPGIAPENYQTFDPDDPTILQNPFVTTGDLADPAVAGKFPPLETMFNNPLLTGANPVIFPEDFLSLQTRVFDMDEDPTNFPTAGRILSLRATPDLLQFPEVPFTPNNQTLPSEQIHFWTDVDNDGDGLNDSMWLPVGTDRYFPDDGLDNDLDGRRDALGIDGIDQEPGDPISDDDEDGEPGVFLYRGDTDGLDNDLSGDPGYGVVDDPAESRYVIFTVPYPFMAGVDNDGDGLVDIVYPTPGEQAAMGFDISVDTLIYEGARDNNTTLYLRELGTSSSGNVIYTRDNDLDLVADQPMDASRYMLTAEAVQALVDADATYPYYQLLLALVGDTNIQNYALAPEDPTRASLQMLGTIRGETVTELSGRMAILIVDESSKVNINAAGGLSYAVLPNTPELPLTRSFDEGVGAHEYELRVLRGIGPALSNKTWTLKMGGAEGRALAADPYGNVLLLTNSLDLTSNFVTDSGNFAYDVSLPGYGWVDDNANLLQLALGRNNYDGLPLDPSYDPSIDAGLEGGRWKGIDEPSEYQRFRPYRNLFAEGDGDATDGFDGNIDGVIDDSTDGDNDDDSVFDEVGEFGDTYYRTHQQLKLVAGIGQGIFDDVRNYVTAHSTDRNDRHFYQGSVLEGYWLAVRRQTTGLRKDLNITRPKFVAGAVMRDWGYPASVPEQRSLTAQSIGALPLTLSDGDFGVTNPAFGSPIDFMLGLRQENVSVATSEAIMGRLDTTPEGTAFTLLADTELRAHQVATTLKDFADRDFTRSVDDETFTEDLWWQELARLAAVENPALLDAAAIAETQRIRYTTAGLEAIRINEVNVRPVRRFESEAITDYDLAEANAATPPDPTGIAFRGLDPNRFVPHGGVYPPADQNDAEDIEEEGFRVRVTTTAAVIDDNFPNLEVDPGDDGNDWRPESLTGLLGLESAWLTYRQYLDVRDTTAADPNRSFEVPDVVQFSFQATDGLPAGRYYLKINTQFVDVNGELINSIVDTSDFAFAVKIGTFEQDWFTDVMNIEAYVEGNAIYNEAWRNPALLGADGIGGSEGMAFLQGDAVFRFNPLIPAGTLFTLTRNDFVLNHTVTDINGNINHEPNLGFTIEVPERDDTAPTIDDELWVHIALRSMREDNLPFVVNYFDFSQEPDHEWVEVTNESDEAVDLSGWQVAVENHPLGFGPMTVPAGTIIAPKGMLILGTNKFDYAYNFDEVTGDIVIQNLDPVLLVDTDPDINPMWDPLNPVSDRGIGFFVNGIALVNEDLTGPASGIFAGVTVPQTFYDTTDITQGSVFYRPGAAPVDYVERDGDGIEDPVPALPDVRPDDVITSTIDHNLLGLGTAFDKPWDRIVELIVPDLVAQAPQTQFAAADVGRIVLGGGIFPNRPESDARDNDGDNAVVGFDNIDNDGDGDIDEVDEGFDEGGFTREERLRDGVTQVPGSFRREIARYLTTFFDFDGDATNGAALHPGYWTGDRDLTDLNITDDPPQWKEFLERRNFPGDNVIVTLYEGPASDAQPADRITYTQRDVENRQIDDVVMVNDFDVQTGSPWPFADDPLFDVSGVRTLGVPIPLDDRFPTFWPEDTMGIDFARSLERKHPSYTGDRFGTQNRFQATDGNYDDWSDSTGRWERLGDLTLPPQFVTDRLDLLSASYAQFAHAVGGTPLRRNVAARYVDDGNRGEVFELTEFSNRPLVSPGSALLAPHTSRTSVLATSIATDPNTTDDTFFPIDRASTNVTLDGSRVDETYDSALLGQRFDDANAPIDFFQDIRSFIGDVGTTDSVSLNVGQAQVIQVLRGTAGGATTPDEAWSINNINVPPTAVPPQTWSPLMFFELELTTGVDDANVSNPPFVDGTIGPYGYESEYLFQPLDTLPATVDNTRWPMPLRAALYASRNFVDFDAVDPYDGAQAVFVWDGDDGLENGEYDLYVVATEDLSLLAQADANVAGGLLTDPSLLGTEQGIGLPFVSATGRTANREVYLDIEVFRDANGDRTAWNDANNDNFITDGDPSTSELNRGQAPGVPFESFGLLEGARPDPDGVIHYGIVKIENNFLAVSLRNRSELGTVARISRVMLAARNKTPGRININTVETRRIDIDDPLNPSDFVNFYNPLTGLPGILSRPADDNGIGAAATFTDPATGDFNAVTGLTDEPVDEEAAQTLAQRIVQQRLRLLSEQPDGRYYELTSDLLADAHFAAINEDLDADNAADLTLRPPLVVERDNILGLPDVNQDNAVDTDADRAGAIAEAAYRFRRMQNLITTRGNAYEILVTVQAGYGSDANGDGRVNWRDDAEFTATAEKTARTIYER